MHDVPYPRLLFVTSSAFNPLSGGGITFTNLFTGWPKDKIATITDDAIVPSTDVCNRYFHLTAREFRWRFPFSLFQSEASRASSTPTKKIIKKSEDKSRGHLFRRIAVGVRPLQRFFFGDEIPVSVQISSELRAWIHAFQPQVIYTILGSLPYMDLVQVIAREFHLPVVIHMMDDWPAIAYRRGLYDVYRRLRMERTLRRMIRDAAACLGICNAMSKAYEARYGVSFTSFHNALSVVQWREASRKEWAAGSPFRVLYAGALMSNSQLKSVAEVAEAIASLAAEGLDVVFEIYAPHYALSRYSDFFIRAPCVKLITAPATMDIASLFASADLLLLPVNFDAASVRYIRYSMPTKVPAYMLSGTPTLAYGPDTVASIQYAKQWAFCATVRGQKSLRAALCTLFSDEILRRALARRAQKLGATRHDAKRVRAAFHQTLIEAASHSYAS